MTFLIGHSRSFRFVSSLLYCLIFVGIPSFITMPRTVTPSRHIQHVALQTNADKSVGPCNQTTPNEQNTATIQWDTLSVDGESYEPLSTFITGAFATFIISTFILWN